MRKKLRIFLTYFPIILVIGQLLCNGLWFLDKASYFEYGFYLNTMFGTNIAFGLFLTCFTFMFPFCYVSRACAVAQLLYAVNYLVVQQDNLYNIIFQIVVGVMALLYTINKYADKFPLCKLGLLKRFFKSVTAEGSCTKGFERYNEETKILIRQRNDFTRNKC